MRANICSKNWKKLIVNASRRSDKVHQRSYNDDDFISREFLQDTLDEQDGKCYYCGSQMLYGLGVSRRHHLGLTVQRINNTIAHVKSNCVLVCFMCNMRSRYVPHSTMVEHGLVIREGIMSYCSCKLHESNDRLFKPSKSGYRKAEHFCKPCLKMLTVKQ